MTDTQRAIMRAAETCFFTDGFDRASVDAIAATARVSKQSIYELFPSKTDLFEAVVRNAIAGGRRNLTEIEVDRSDPVATLNRFGRRLFDKFIQSRNLGLFRANIVATRQLPELAADLHEDRLASSEAVGRFIQTLVADGVMLPCDAMRAGVRLGGLVVEGSRYFLGFAPPRDAARDTLVASNVALFLNGYRVLESSDTPLPDEQPVPMPTIGGQVALRLSATKLRTLLDAATAEFFAKGYTGASVDRIAREAGVGKSTIHRQFGSKEGLFRHIVLSKLHEISVSDRFAVPPGAGIDDAVAAFARHLLDAHLAPDRIAFHQLMIQEADPFADLARQLYDVQIATIARTLDPLLAAHGWPRPGAAAVKAFHTLATFGVRFLTAARFPDKAQRDELSAEAARIFLHGLSAN